MSLENIGGPRRHLTTILNATASIQQWLDYLDAYQVEIDEWQSDDVERLLFEAGELLRLAASAVETTAEPILKQKAENGAIEPLVEMLAEQDRAKKKTGILRRPPDATRKLLKRKPI